MSTDAPRPAPAPPDVADHHALPAGTRFGEFEIVRVLGEGGFGIVYLALDHSLEREVALKEYMPATLAVRGPGPALTVRSGAHADTYAMGLRSFINEARLLARFDHPSLVKVYRFWEDNATAYMVMPYLQGTTLRDARRAMAQPPSEAWLRAVLDPLLDALSHLHREGVFHRDIAPDNIVLPPVGPPVLLDFGAARRVIGDRTQSLTAILKPSYAPIEQYADMPAMRQGPWTDLYALGAVLHHLLLGVPPAPATVRAVQHDADTLDQHVLPGVSPRFMSAVAWMLGVRPLERPQSVAELRAALNGERAIPAAARHERTVTMAPSAPGLDPQAVTLPSMPAAPAMPYPPLAPAARAAASRAALIETRHPTTSPIAARVAQPPDTTLNPVQAAELISGAVPPGQLPPVSMPAMKARHVAVPVTTPPPERVTPPAAPRSSRLHGWHWSGVALAVVAAAVVLWQFVALLSAPREATTSITAKATRAPALSTPAPRPTAPAIPASAALPPQGPVVAAGTDVAEPVSAPVVLVPPTDGRALSRSAGVSPRGAPGALGSESASPRALCSNRQFFARAACMDRVCEQPRHRHSAECVNVLAMKERRQAARER